MGLKAIENNGVYKQMQGSLTKEVAAPVQTQQSGQDKVVVIQENAANNSGFDSSQNKEQYEEQRLRSALNVANTKMKNTSTRCEFSYHEATKRVSIKVIDKDTEEVIKEIPPEETLEMVERMWELAGLLVDERC